MKSRSDVAVVLFLILVALLSIVFLAKNEFTLCGPEQFFVYYPVLSHWLSQFYNGNIPWISNAVAGGIPLWADPNLGIFYPGNIIYLALPFNDAWNASLILHLFWAQCGVYWLCRKQELPVSASLTGSFAFLFSVPFLAALNSNEVIAATSWMPWILGLSFSGLKQSYRRTLLASVALSCQWLSGFTYVQAFTAVLVVMICVAAYWQKKQQIVLMRSLLLILIAVLLTAIQWLPALLWFPNADNDLFQTQPGVFPYFGWLAVVLFVVGLRKKNVWVALILIPIDYALFHGSVVFAFCLAMGAAFGTAELLRPRRRILAVLLPAAVAMELMIVNWNVPQSLPESQLRKAPPIVMEIPDIKNWNIHNSGTKSALSPLAGLSWGLHYSTPPEKGLMLWKALSDRTEAIEYALRTRTNLQLMRDARVGYVISDVRFNHRELGLVKQNATRFFVHRLRIPVSPLITSSNGSENISWSEIAPDALLLESGGEQSAELTVHRNALPGWQCKIQDKIVPIRTDPNGWMKLQVPAGKIQAHLSYRTPGAEIGTLITLIGTILILAFLLL